MAAADSADCNLDRLAEVLAAALASWWRTQHEDAARAKAASTDRRNPDGVTTTAQPSVTA